MSEVLARESPWGPMVVVDAHVHFFSYGFFEILATQKPGLTIDAVRQQLDWQFPPARPAELAATWARELDRHGVHRAALIASVPGDEATVVAAVRAHPDRFFSFAMVNPRAWNPEALAGVQVACLFPAMHRFSMHEDVADPVFQWAAQGQRAVFVHCGALSVGVREKLGLQSAFDLRYSNPADVHSVALKYPAVPIVIPHFGAGYFREALMLADLCPNVYLDTSSSNRWMRYQESQLDLRQVFRRALDVVGPRRLLFGTDSSFFPRGWHYQIFEEQAKALYELGVSVADARGIFGENLLRILRH
ncbi:MAG TPA: amidohydrolase family protein [Bryobacteraceae bacterium]|nr:amidohydrolase family protein [Bryobacteraceae bacterium]